MYEQRIIDSVSKVSAIDIPKLISIYVNFYAIIYLSFHPQMSLNICSSSTTTHGQLELELELLQSSKLKAVVSYNHNTCGDDLFGALDGGVPMSRVDFKKQ